MGKMPLTLIILLVVVILWLHYGTPSFKPSGGRAWGEPGSGNPDNPNVPIDNSDPTAPDGGLKVMPPQGGGLQVVPLNPASPRINLPRPNTPEFNYNPWAGR